jgi:anti-sigma factor RsiW
MWKRTDGACGRTARWLGEYSDGTLPLPRRRVVEAHLRACAACRRELEATRRTLALLADLPRRELSDQFDVLLHARLAEVEGVGRRRWWALFPVARHLRAPWPSPLQRLAPAGALAAGALALAVWQIQPLQHHRTVPSDPPAYVAALVQEHQLLGAGADLNSTVVSHNLGDGVLEEGEEE